MEKKCARCGNVMNVFATKSETSAIAEPWFCPNCINYKDEPMPTDTKAKLAQTEYRLKVAEKLCEDLGRLEDTLRQQLEEAREAVQGLLILERKPVSESVRDLFVSRGMAFLDRTASSEGSQP